MFKINILPKDFLVRAPSMDDVQEITELIAACDIAEYGEPDITEGDMPGDFEKWEHWTVKREDFDPTLWFLAFDGDQLAGASLCKYQVDVGWVDDLGVRRPWRRKGLGLALLHHSFSEFYRRGMRKVGLGVDTQNLTGATRLYKRAGMQPVREYIGYEKELRAGVELSTQAIMV